MSFQTISPYSKNWTNTGILNYAPFKKNLLNGNFTKMYIFIDGSYLKSKKGKLFYRKVKKYGQPVVVISVNMLKNIPDLDRRASIADDINQDLIWIQKTIEPLK